VLRPFLATLAVITATLVAATPGVSEAPPSVSVSVTGSGPTASGGRAPGGLRSYGVTFHVRIASDQECENLSVTYSYAARFDGRPSLAGSGTEFYNSGAPASSATFDVQAAGNAADVVSFTGRGACEQADGTVLATSAEVNAKIDVPAHSCEQGPLRVLGASGSVVRRDLSSPSTTVRVRTGNHLWSGYQVTLGRRSRLVFGARECRGLRVIATGPAKIVPGDYSARAEGAPMRLGRGGVVDFRGDQHSGGVQTANAIALPRGARHAPSKLARFQVVSVSGKLTRVHVRSGTVYIARRVGRGRYASAAVAKTGQTLLVR
jgi:hypothetical protein